jgi:hypothetical protein
LTILIQDDLIVSLLESAVHSAWIRATLGCHGCNDNCPDVAIHLVRADNEAWAGLLDLAPYGRIKVHEMHLEALHHVHSVSSHSESTMAGIQELVVGTLSHLGESFVPPVTRLPGLLDNDRGVMNLELHFIREARLLEQ